MINSMMLHSFQDNAGIRVNGSSKNMLAHVLLSLLVFEHGAFTKLQVFRTATLLKKTPTQVFSCDV